MLIHINEMGQGWGNIWVGQYLRRNAVSWWRHAIEMFRITDRLWGEPPVNDEFLHKGSVMRSFVFFLVIVMNKPLNKQPVVVQFRCNTANVTSLWFSNTNRTRILYMFANLQYHVWFCIAVRRPFTFLCNVRVPHNELSLVTFQAVSDNTGLTLTDEL